DPDLAPRRAVCARRPDRKRAVVEPRIDRIMEPLQRADRRERTRLHRDLRRHPLLLRHPAVGRRQAMRARPLIIVVVTSMLAAGLAFAQVGRGGSQWLTALGDAQRTSWVRTDDKISVPAMSKPGFELQWQAKLDNQPRGVHGLGQGVTAAGVTLFIPMSLVTGSSNTVYGIDNDLGYI